MKWIKLLWSVVLLGFLALAIARLSTNNTGALSPAFGYSAILWVGLLIISPIILLLRIFRVIKQADSFIYILIGTANLAIGLAGLYLLLSSPAKDDHRTLFLLILNVLIGAFVFIDAFIRTIPGYEKTE